MPGISRGLESVSTETHRQWLIAGDRDADQPVEIDRADASLQPTDHHATKASSSAKLDPRPAASFAQRVDLRAESGALLAKTPIDFDRGSRASCAGHDRAMFIEATAPRLSGRAAAGSAFDGRLSAIE